MRIQGRIGAEPAAPGQSAAWPGWPATPWGVPDSVRCIAAGIWWVSTPSHGGYWLSPDRLAAMPEPFKVLKTFGSVGPQWFEEDCDWAIVALAFPAEMAVEPAERNAEMFRAARDTFAACHLDRLDVAGQVSAYFDHLRANVPGCGAL